MSNRTRTIGIGALLFYGVAIYGANWMIHNVGPIVVPGGNHLVPLGFGLAAPSGTFLAALVLVARDVVQRTLGRWWSVAVIIPGALLSATLDPHLGLASGLAFLFSETADFFVYTPLQRRGFVRALVASGAVGSVVDSILFLGVAGIPLAVALPGLLAAKVIVVVVASLGVGTTRRWITPVVATS